MVFDDLLLEKQNKCEAYYTRGRHSNVLASGTKKILLWGVQGGTAPPNLNMGPPKISETTRGRMLKLNTQLDIVKYSLCVKKFLR